MEEQLRLQIIGMLHGDITSREDAPTNYDESEKTGTLEIFIHSYHMKTTEGLCYIKGVLFDKDGTLLEFQSTMHYLYTNFLSTFVERYKVPELLLHDLQNALGHQPDQLKADSLLQFSTNPQIADAMLESSKKIHF